MPSRSQLRAFVRTGGLGGQVGFLIDGVALLELLGLRTGDWVGPPPGVVCPPSDHLFGGPDRWEDPNDPWFGNDLVAVAACGCGQPGCRAVLMTVSMKTDEVVWSGFRIHSDETALGGEWRFNPRQYRAAIRAVCPGT